MTKPESALKKFLEKKYQILINENQAKALLMLNRTKFYEHQMFPRSARNRPFYALSQYALIDFDSGPRDFAFQTYGFMLTEKAKDHLDAFFKENENLKPEAKSSDQTEWMKDSSMCRSLAFAIN